MSKYFFSIILILCFLTSQSQEKTQDTIKPISERYGLRVGMDLFKIARSSYDKNYKGLEFVGDFRYNKNYYLAAEIVSESKTTIDPQITSIANGTYLKAGFDYNLHKNWLDLENIISVGARYGISTFSQELSSYKVYNKNQFLQETFEIPVGEKYSGLSAQWIEIAAGVKTKVINNFFVGFSIRLNMLVYNKKPEGFDNLYIPGFNRTYDGSFGAGFNYTISYFIPLYKKKILPKKAEEKKKDKKF
jgi:hypothetical protein